MSRPLESFEYLNRGWDVRLLESSSLRSLFVLVLVDLFMLGMLTFMMIYEIVRRHPFEWSIAIISLTLLLSAIRYVPLIYRRLGR